MSGARKYRIVAKNIGMVEDMDKEMPEIIRHTRGNGSNEKYEYHKLREALMQQARSGRAPRQPYRLSVYQLGEWTIPPK